MTIILKNIVSRLSLTLKALIGSIKDILCIFTYFFRIIMINGTTNTFSDTIKACDCGRRTNNQGKRHDNSLFKNNSNCLTNFLVDRLNPLQDILKYEILDLAPSLIFFQ